MPDRDFLALNKAAVQSGLTTAQEQQQYRATHDIRKKDDSERMASKSTLKFDEDMVFGISTRLGECTFITRHSLVDKMAWHLRWGTPYLAC